MQLIDLHERLGLEFSGVYPGSALSYQSALSAVAILVADDEIEGAVAYFDHGWIEARETEAEIALHIRVLTAVGIIRLDFDFDFDGAPDAHLIPWSQVQRLHVIAARDIEPSPV